MRLPRKKEPGREWVTTLSWPDKVIARCFPRFFNSYAPEEIKVQWAQYQEKKHGRGKEPPGESEFGPNTGPKSDNADSKNKGD